MSFETSFYGFVNLVFFSELKALDDFVRVSTHIVDQRVNLYLRWPTTVTSKPNAHSKLQSAHIKFKSLTSNSNRSQQIQITHSKLQIAQSKFKSPTANSNRSQQIKVAHSKFKSPTANSNRSQQIKVAHSKFKLLTSNYKLNARRVRLSTASGTTRLKIFVIHEAATL